MYPNKLGYVLGVATYPRVKEQHIAVFGESGSGKTVLVSSFFGPSQSASGASDLWDLVADDAGQGNRLLKNYLGMRDKAVAPPATRFASDTYNFSVKLKSAGDRERDKRPFDVIRLAWHDYPGEWFESEPSSPSEATRRTDTFRSLLRSDVALLLVDGQKLADHRGEEARYLKSLFGNFRQAMLRLKDDLLAEEGRLVEFPRIWILALSKADLYPDWDVDNFRDLLVLNAADDIERLRSTIQELVETPDALSLGEDFLLLSSAKFSLDQGSQHTTSIDTTARVGLDLVLPVASLLPLERRVLWASKMDVPRKVLDSLADGADLIAKAITGSNFAKLDKALSMLPDRRVRVARQVITRGTPLLAMAAKMAGPALREQNEQARAQHDYLRATLTQMKQDLEEGRADSVIRTAV